MKRREFSKTLLSIMTTGLTANLLNSCLPSNYLKLPNSKYLVNSNMRITIIGGGISGLAAGAFLTKMGFKVLILEKNKEILGGHARTKIIESMKFCVGPQYVWNFGEGQNGFNLLKYLGLHNNVKFKLMDNKSFESCFIGDKLFKIPMGLESFSGLLKNNFPKESKKISDFFYLINLLTNASTILHKEGLYMEDMSTMKLNLIFNSEFGIKEKYLLNKFSSCTLNDVFNELELSSEIRKILFSYGGIFAENIESLSFGVYASATGFYHKGAYYPEKGFEHFISAIADFINMNGGVISLGKEVNEIITTNGNINKIICTDGTEYLADYVISNISPNLLFPLLSPKIDHKKITPSNSLISCYIGIEGNNEINNMLKGRNFWWQSPANIIDFNNPDCFGTPNYLYIGSQTAQGYNHSEFNPLLESLIVFLPGSYKQFKDINKSENYVYDKLKETIKKNILDILSTDIFPGIKNNVQFIKVDTPLDIEKEINSENGNVYGRSLSVNSIECGLNLSNEIDNLEFACASVGLPGVETCLNTAKLIVEKITGRKIL